MKKLILIAMVAATTGCCDIVKTDYHVVEKLHTQNRDGSTIYYKIILSNGEEYPITSLQYINAKEGDIWTVTECK